MILKAWKHLTQKECPPKKILRWPDPDPDRIRHRSGIRRADPDSAGTGSSQLFSSEFIKSDAESMETINTGDRRDSSPKKYLDDPTPIPTESGIDRGSVGPIPTRPEIVRASFFHQNSSRNDPESMKTLNTQRISAQKNIEITRP